ncbi:MAG: response regulator [Salibacteraceae bacterium]
MKSTIKKILIADDHPLLLIGLKGMIEDIGGYEIIGQATNGNEAIEFAIKNQPDISILDLEMPQENGIEVLRTIKSKCQKCKVAILTSHKEEVYLKQAIDAGADGYLLKEFANLEITKCLSKFEQNQPYYSEQLDAYINSNVGPDKNYEKLSRSEKKVVRLISQEKSSKEIGDILFISPKTVDNHRSNIIKKLEIQPKKNSLFIWATRNKAYL